ncbi:MAG: 2-oxo acid dehydrogenase subunit E2 [Bacteroidetes bacterium]|nr:2-oxo acid dehydrogenase subunit E2 [Bacteroidota bacterium]
MAVFELVMPKMGESIMEATIISWSKQVGDAIDQDETVLEIATDKVDSEVPSPVEGKLVEILFKDGDVVPVGQVVARIETAAAGGGSAPAVAPATPVAVPAAAERGTVAQVAAQTTASPVAAAVLSAPADDRFYSPLVMSIAREEKISQDELNRIPGTGREGRVTKQDILAYVSNRQKGGVSAPPSVHSNGKAPAAAPVAGGFHIPQKTFSFNGEYEILEMDRMRKMIAENMVYSKHVSPHVTSFVEADVTNIVLWREKNKKAFEQKYKQKITFTPIFMEAVAKTLRDFPMVNISVDGDRILVKKDINIGMAAALPSGNLIVPVIKNADRLNLAGLAAVVNDLTDRARANKLKPEEIQDGTYTLSNVGTFGNVMGTPIIPQPQVAVLAVGAIKKKPAVIETPAGDLIGIRHMMFLSHSYDHRVVDGSLGGMFVRKVADYLEAFDPNREV